MKQSNDKVYVKETVRFLSLNMYSTSSVSKRQTGASQSTKRGGNLADSKWSLCSYWRNIPVCLKRHFAVKKKSMKFLTTCTTTYIQMHIHICTLT